MIKLKDEAKLGREVRVAVASVLGTEDHVVADIILRHVRACSTSTSPGQAMQRVSPLSPFVVWQLQFERCGHQADENIRSTELAHLLQVLTGVDPAIDLVRASLAILEEGRRESWYEANLRKKYGG